MTLDSGPYAKTGKQYQRKMIRIGILGRNSTADHVRLARAYAGAGIVAIGAECGEPEFSFEGEVPTIENWRSAFQELVERNKIDVLHIMTPPETHFTLAEDALSAGCHVLMENPIALDSAQAFKLFEIGRKNHRMLCIASDFLFEPCYQKALHLIQSGNAGRVEKVEVFYGVDTRSEDFRSYEMPNALPPAFNLIGGLYPYAIQIPLCILLNLIGDPEAISVSEKSCGELPQNISDEVQVSIQGAKAKGVLTLSFAAKPPLNHASLQCTKTTIEVNFNSMKMTDRPTSLFSGIAHREMLLKTAASQVRTNKRLIERHIFAKARKPFQGSRALMHRFYDAIQGRGNVPISPQDAMRVINTADVVLSQIRNRMLNFEPILPSALKSGREFKAKVLVTGATGFLGGQVVLKLIEANFCARAFVRKLANTEKLKLIGAEIYFGDVGDDNSLAAALNGVDIVVHAAANTSGNNRDGMVSTIAGTRNVLREAQVQGVKQLIYISTCNVYGIADCRPSDQVDESGPLERQPDNRGSYTCAKFQAEQIVREAMKNGQVNITCLRPGTIWGPGGATYTPMMGFRAGRKIFGIIGNGKFILPLVYIANLVDAIISCIGNQGAYNQIFNVVDKERVTKKRYFDTVLRKLYPDAMTFNIPYGLLYSTVWSQEVLFKLLGLPALLTRYRLTSSQRQIIYDAGKLERELGWAAPVCFEEAANEVIRFEQSR